MGKSQWIRKSELDRRLGRHLPVPTQVVSNEEFWWGSPQWQIDALRRLQMPASLAERFGWVPLT